MKFASEFTVARNFQQQPDPHSIPPTISAPLSVANNNTDLLLLNDQLQDFLSSFPASSLSQSPVGADGSEFQPFAFDDGVLDTAASRLPFSDYSEDSFIDVVSPVCPSPTHRTSTPSPAIPCDAEAEIRRQRLAHKAELARANRKRKKELQQPGTSNPNIPRNDSYPSIPRNGSYGSDLDSEGSRSPQSDYTDMSMSPGPAQHWDEEEEIRRKRLARKAELARVSRKKKKDRIEELEAQLTQMQHELALARQLNVSMTLKDTNFPLCKTETNNNATSTATGRDVVTPLSANEQLNRAMSDFANPNYLGTLYSSFVEKVRADLVSIDQLQTSMQSSLCVRFVQWIMNQNEKFYEDPCGLWYSLFSQEIGAAPAQLAQLLALRKEFAQKPVISAGGSDAVSQAFDVLRKAMDDSSRMMGAFAQIFNPQQLAVFFQWVERFGPVCIKINL